MSQFLRKVSHLGVDHVWNEQSLQLSTFVISAAAPDVVSNNFAGGKEGNAGNEDKKNLHFLYLALHHFSVNRCQQAVVSIKHLHCI
jgi:hypothetical protein